MPVRRPIAILLLLAWATACSAWTPRTTPVPDADPLPSQLRLALADGRHVILDDAVVTRDSVTGTEYRGRRRAFGIAEVRAVETREMNWGGTALVVGTLVVFAVLAARPATRHYCDVACARP